MKKTISPTSTIVASADQISCDLDGEAAILNLKSGTYFGLDPVGATVWSLIVQPRRVAEIRDSLLETYDVEADRCSADLLQLLGDLHAHGLIQILDEPASSDRGSDEKIS